jgi:NAD+ synthase (glutamine-hydrolysing)
MHGHGFVRVATSTPRVRTADIAYNRDGIIEEARARARRHVDLLVYPELCVSSYAIDDLHLQSALLDACEARRRDRRRQRRPHPVLLIGAPLRHNGRLYNCALRSPTASCSARCPRATCPTTASSTRSAGSPRHHRQGPGDPRRRARIPFGTDLVFASNQLSGFRLVSRSARTSGPPTRRDQRRARRRDDPRQPLGLEHRHRQGRRAPHAVPRAVGAHGQRLCLLGRRPRREHHRHGVGRPGDDLRARRPARRKRALRAAARARIADIDTDRILGDRLRIPTFNDAAEAAGRPEDRSARSLRPPPAPGDIGLVRPIRRFPFVPNRPEKLDADCFEAFNIQVDGLLRRFEQTGGGSMVIGVSGGLDSTHALIVAAKVCDRLGLPRTTIRGYTLPGFGTSEGTKSNAWKLMTALGITAEEIDIRPTAMTMLANIGHPFARGEPVHDVTFENVQAGLRTDYLFRLAGRHGGFVLGTGDLSEVALGWSTYGVGDQMSHYNVNAGVPKTLIQYLIRWCARTDQFDRETDAVLEAILAQEISPELVPVGEDGEVQSTEAKIGPYELNDFFLHHVVRFGQRPSKIAFLAWHAWRDKARGAWPAASPRPAATNTTSPRSAAGSKASSSASSPSASSSAARSPTAPRSRPPAR